MRLILAIGLLLLSGSAMAQQPPTDPEFLQRLLQSMQQQRNQAMDAAAISDAKATNLNEELTKAKAKIQKLEAQNPEPKK